MVGILASPAAPPTGTPGAHASAFGSTAAEVEASVQQGSGDLLLPTIMGLAFIAGIAFVIALVAVWRWSRRVEQSRQRPALEAQSRRALLSATSSREHDLGIRPCSQPGCQECALYVARARSDLHQWKPGTADPSAVEGAIATVERVSRYKQSVDLYYLDPLAPGEPAWLVEASHVVLANELSRFGAGDRVRITFHGNRVSRSTGRSYYSYSVRQLP